MCGPPKSGGHEPLFLLLVVFVCGVWWRTKEDQNQENNNQNKENNGRTEQKHHISYKSRTLSQCLHTKIENNTKNSKLGQFLLVVSNLCTTPQHTTTVPGAGHAAVPLLCSNVTPDDTNAARADPVHSELEKVVDRFAISVAANPRAYSFKKYYY